MSTTDDAVPFRLRDGLVMRSARPDELDQIGELLVDRGEEPDALDHRLVVEDPDLGWDACGVVVDGDRVVATATLLDETVLVRGGGATVTLPAGQVELVAVARTHEHRGLARALMGWAHDRAAARGHVLGVMIGIPYFYRRFGYEYAITMPPARGVERLPAVAAEPATPTLRPATAADVPALVALQDGAQASFDVAVPHPAARWRAALAQSAAELLVLERDGVVVASARVRRDDDGALVAEPAAADAADADALLTALAAELAPQDPTALAVVHRAGTVTGDAWDALLADPDDSCEQYYVRVPDHAALLDAIRPVLTARVHAAGLAADVAGTPTGGLLVSTFGAHHRLPWGPDGRGGEGFGPVETGGPMQSPGELRGFGVAPDQLGALVLGAGFDALRRTRPDVYGPRALGPALFPPTRGDVLSYYLPW